MPQNEALSISETFTLKIFFLVIIFKCARAIDSVCHQRVLVKIVILFY